ncbi:MAG TPA: hypothetical protein VGU01_09535 [Sphingomicrobium sp.]|nr:hypothetical protein [Sphingomicrobium sp.]
MGDDRTAALPDGTDHVIEGAAKTKNGETATVEDMALVTQQGTLASSDEAERPAIGSASAKTGTTTGVSSDSSKADTESESQSSIVERIRSGREQLSSQAGDKARGLVTQGLERTSEALANVARMVGDTAPGIEERLGADYGDYARRAAGSIENVANTIASKNPDELIEDTRNFVRNSPGIALAGAAVVGFVVARLLKTGLAATSSSDENAER